MSTARKEYRKVPSIGDRIVKGLTEFKEALEKNEPIAKKFTVRTIQLDLEPQPFTPVRVVRIRESLRLSQAVFAELLGVSAFAVRSWEQGKREPTKMARRLLDEMEINPSRWLEILQNAVRRRPQTTGA